MNRCTRIGPREVAMSTKVSAIIVIDVTDICHEPLPVCQEIINYLQKFHSGCPETKADLTSALPRGNILDECPDAGWIQTPRNFASKYLFLGSFDRCVSAVGGEVVVGPPPVLGLSLNIGI